MADETTEEPQAPADPPEPPAGARSPANKPARPGAVAATTGGHAIVVAQPAPVGPVLPKVSRRGVLRIGFWAGLGVMLASIGSTIVYSLYPQRTLVPGGQQLFGTSEVSPFGSQISVGPLSLFEEGKPVHNLDARAWIMKFDKRHADIENMAGNHVKPGAILALYQKCPHLGCTVPWRADFTWTDDRPGVNQTYSGWMRCPCHGSTYTFGGVRVFGPAPRSMDTFAITVVNGNLVVDTGKITLGDTHDPNRAIMP
ncbi:MAG: QcrA and Rieske domain-containing protein [Dehalococcoidia bacterium]